MLNQPYFTRQYPVGTRCSYTMIVRRAGGRMDVLCYMGNNPRVLHSYGNLFLNLASFKKNNVIFLKVEGNKLEKQIKF